MTVSYLPTRTDATAHHATEIGVDLSSLGATERNEIVPELPPAPADLLRLAAIARSITRAGLAFTTLGPSFRLQPGSRHDASLDALVAARRISSAAAGDVVPSIPVTTGPREALAEIARFSRKHGGPAGIQLELGEHAGTGTAARARRLADALRDARPAQPPRIIVALRAEADVAVAGEAADVVRLAEPDLGWARELRYAVRAAALAAGRTPVPVLVDTRTIIAEDPVAARVRAELVEHLDPPRGPAPLSIVGTATDATDTLARWLEGGAADGFVIRPASLPTDIAALVREVLPALRERGFTTEDAAAAGRRELLSAAG